VSGTTAKGLLLAGKRARNAILPWGLLFNPKKLCLPYAICRCIELARRARTLEGRQTFQFLADRWKGLAADIERAEASLEKLNEKGFRRSPTYPYD
jgi:hypothetical protein